MKPLIRILALSLLCASATIGAQPPAGTQSTTIRITTRTPAPTGPASPRREPTASGSSNFTGSVRVQSVFQATSPGRSAGSDVTFEPGARTAWHTHPAGQTLIVVAGVGRVQQWGAAIEEIRPGDVVQIPPDVKHWHGASPSSTMTHLAIGESVDGRSVVWAEPVSDAQYNASVRARAAAEAAPSRTARAIGDSAAPSVTPRTMNEFAPRLAELTNRVLYGEVWPDSSLSQRDRSLVTVSALIAMNRPDQLRSHLGRARANGVTKAEVAALITHLAFYSGWPSAVTAVNLAAEVYQER